MRWLVRDSWINPWLSDHSAGPVATAPGCSACSPHSSVNEALAVAPADDVTSLDDGKRPRNLQPSLTRVAGSANTITSITSSLLTVSGGGVLFRAFPV